MLLGFLSDTHGLLRPAVLELLDGVDRIVHAGDVGDPRILEQLGRVAPVRAVRGNVDVEPPLSGLPRRLEEELEFGWALRVVHRREEIEDDWLRPHTLVVFGHSHRPELEWRGGALLLNPGACGPRRFSLPLTVARVWIDGRRLAPEILAVEADRRPSPGKDRIPGRSG